MLVLVVAVAVRTEQTCLLGKVVHVEQDHAGWLPRYLAIYALVECEDLDTSALAQHTHDPRAPNGWVAI